MAASLRRVGFARRLSESRNSDRKASADPGNNTARRRAERPRQSVAADDRIPEYARETWRQLVQQPRRRLWVFSATAEKESGRGEALQPDTEPPAAERDREASFPPAPAAGAPSTDNSRPPSGSRGSLQACAVCSTRHRVPATTDLPAPSRDRRLGP